MPVNQKTLARAPPSQGDASEWTRFKRLSSEASVIPTKQNPQRVYRFPFPQIQKIWQGIEYPPAAFPPGVPGDWNRAYQKSVSGGTPTLQDPSSWGTAYPAAAAIPQLQKGADGQLIPLFVDTDVSPPTLVRYIVIHFTGQFQAPENGTQVFNVTSDDGFQLDIDGNLILNALDVNNGIGQSMLNGVLTRYNSAAIQLTAGSHNINALQGNGAGALSLIINSVKINGQSQGGPIFDLFYH